jgi:hypothetical protein
MPTVKLTAYVDPDTYDQLQAFVEQSSEHHSLSGATEAMVEDGLADAEVGGDE